MIVSRVMGASSECTQRGARFRFSSVRRRMARWRTLQEPCPTLCGESTAPLGLEFLLVDRFQGLTPLAIECHRFAAPKLAPDAFISSSFACASAQCAQSSFDRSLNFFRGGHAAGALVSATEPAFFGVDD